MTRSLSALAELAEQIEGHRTNGWRVPFDGSTKVFAEVAAVPTRLRVLLNSLLFQRTPSEENVTSRGSLPKGSGNTLVVRKSRV
jgi:hypothetical protein